MDGRKGNGGARAGAGRKPKAQEIQLIEKLSPMADAAYKALQDGVKSGDFAFIKLWFEYVHGKPKQTIDANVNGEMSINWSEERTYEAKR